MRAKWGGRSRSSGGGRPSCGGTRTSRRCTTGGVRCWNALASATEALRNSLTRAIALRPHRSSSPILRSPTFGLSGRATWPRDVARFAPGYWCL
jgi:hypothetical protein